jgi:serine/threonine protein kinase
LHTFFFFFFSLFFFEVNGRILKKKKKKKVKKSAHMAAASDSVLRHFDCARTGQIEWHQVDSDDGLQRQQMRVSVGGALLYECDQRNVCGKTKTSVVYKARECTGAKRLVALKCIDLVGLLSSSVESRRREAMAKYLGSEARIALELSGHANIVSLFDVVVCERFETLCFAMELMEGGDLDSAMQRREPMPVHIVQRLASQLKRGMQVLHQHHIIHRDLKPASVFCRRKPSEG